MIIQLYMFVLFIDQPHQPTRSTAAPVISGGTRKRAGTALQRQAGNVKLGWAKWSDFPGKPGRKLLEQLVFGREHPWNTGLEIFISSNSRIGGAGRMMHARLKSSCIIRHRSSQWHFACPASWVSSQTEAIQKTCGFSWVLWVPGFIGGIFLQHRNWCLSQNMSELLWRSTFVSKENPCNSG